MRIVFDRAVDPGLIERALAPSVRGSMWLDPAVLGVRPDYPRLPGATTCDLLVVGGGYTGLWTALHAAERDPDARVVLIESQRLGWGASGRTAASSMPASPHGAEARNRALAGGIRPA